MLDNFKGFITQLFQAQKKPLMRIRLSNEKIRQLYIETYMPGYDEMTLKTVDRFIYIESDRVVALEQAKLVVRWFLSRASDDGVITLTKRDMKQLQQVLSASENIVIPLFRKEEKVQSVTSTEESEHEDE